MTEASEAVMWSTVGASLFLLAFVSCPYKHAHTIAFITPCKEIDMRRRERERDNYFEESRFRSVSQVHTYTAPYVFLLIAYQQIVSSSRVQSCASLCRSANTHICIWISVSLMNAQLFTNRCFHSFRSILDLAFCKSCNLHRLFSIRVYWL